MGSFWRGVQDGKDENMKNPKCWGAIVVGIMMLMASHGAFAGEYRYPDHLPQRTVKFYPYVDPGNSTYHSHIIKTEPIDAKYFQDSPADCVTLEFHYCDKYGNDSLGRNRNQNSNGKGGNYSGEVFKKKGDLGDIEALYFEWFVNTEVDSPGLTYCGYNRIYLENPQLGDVYRCYLLYNKGEHSWVSQEFGVQCGGKGRHAHCSQCFMPVTVPRNKTLAATTAERLQRLERDAGSVSPGLNSLREGNGLPPASRYEIIPWTTGWYTAKADAEARGGHLATITSEEEWNTICQLFSPGELKGTWLGATDAKSEGIWQWVTGEPFTYARWSAGEPNNWKDMEHYLGIQIVDSLPWNDFSEPHKDVTKYLFEREDGTVPPAMRTPNTRTEASQESRYELIPYLGVWHEAKADAEARGGHLATITSEEEWNTICQLFSTEELKGTWLGATDEKSEGTWQWVTGEPFTYARWGAGEPNNWKGVEHYLGIQTVDSLHWNDFSGPQKMSKYLFEHDSGSVKESRTIRPPASLRPVPPNAIDVTEITILPESGTPELLREMTDAFVSDIGKINAAADAKQEQLTRYVLEHLDEAMENARQKGDFENSLALMKYKEQFDTMAGSDNPTISNFIAFRAKKSAEIEKARVTYALQAAQTFYGNLEQAKRAETKNANMDNAMAFAEQQKKVKEWASRLAGGQTEKKTVAETPRQASGYSPSVPVGVSARTAKPVPPIAGSGTSEKSLPLGNGVVLQMVHCPEVSPDFWIGKYEVTQEQWMRVMHSNPSTFRDRNNPVENVTWEACMEFAEKLNKLTSLRGSGFTFRLPTCEEWKKACRAPATGSGAFCRLADGTEITAETLDRVAWFGDQKQTSNVGCLEPNAWGLYDMLGNVWEWNQDETSEKKHTRIGGSITDTAEHSNGRYYWHTPHGRAYPTVGVRIAADWKAP